jgi:hypothetical protein
MTSPLLLIPSINNKPRMLNNFACVVDTGNASLTGVNDTGNACIAITNFDVWSLTFKEQSVKINYQ